jgi:hypothetical protein
MIILKFDKNSNLTLELDQGKNIPSEKRPRVIPPTIPLKLSAT